MSTPPSRRNPAPALWLLALLAAAGLPAGRPGAAPLPRGTEGILGEIATPPVSIFAADLKRPAGLPAFATDVLDKYRAAPDARSRLRRAVRQAQLALWAAAPTPAPAALRAEVRKVRAAWKIDVGTLPTTYRAPAPGAAALFSRRLFQENRALARIVGRLEDTLEELQAVGGERARQPKRWQANYDLLLGRLLAQLALLSEHQSALGMLRRDPPPLNPARHGGWGLRPDPALHDAEGRKFARQAARLFAQVMREHPGTPWEVLARQHASRPLGLSWEPVP
jgi:hypothetical protein